MLNNLGMANWYDFVIQSQALVNPQTAGIEALKPVIECFEESIYNLKKSIHALENFEQRFKVLESGEF